MSTHPMDALFHRLWTKAVGTEDYDKDEWKRLNNFIVRQCSTFLPLSSRKPGEADADYRARLCNELFMEEFVIQIASGEELDRFADVAHARVVQGGMKVRAPYDPLIRPGPPEEVPCPQTSTVRVVQSAEE